MANANQYFSGSYYQWHKPEIEDCINETRAYLSSSPNFLGHIVAKFNNAENLAEQCPEGDPDFFVSQQREFPLYVLNYTARNLPEDLATKLENLGWIEDA